MRAVTEDEWVRWVSAKERLYVAVTDEDVEKAMSCVTEMNGIGAAMCECDAERDEWFRRIGDLRCKVREMCA